MTISLIIAILFVGIILVLLEIIVFPGMSLAGIVGGGLLFFGVYASYHYHDNEVGNAVLGGTLLITAVATYVALRYASWRSVSLEQSIDAKLELLKGKNIAKGQKFKTVSRLAPSGSIMVDGSLVEAKSESGFIDEGKLVEVVKIQNNFVVVIECKVSSDEKNGDK